MKKYITMLSWMYKQLDNVHESNDDEMSANCPFCESRKGSPDIKRHLSANKYNRLCHCFRCDWSGTWTTLVMQTDGCSYLEALSRITDNPKIENYREATEEFIDDNELTGDDVLKTNIHSSFPVGYMTLDNSDDNMTYRIAVSYLRSRGMGEDFIFSGLFGIVPGVLRLFMSASDTYWQARRLMKSMNPKYLNPKVDIFDILGLWDVSGLRDYLNNGGDELYVCEGIFSALALICRGKPAIALLGKIAREEQIIRLCELDKKLIIMMDSDATNNSWKIAERLIEAGKKDVNVAILEYGDPDTCAKHEVKEVNWKSKALWRLQT